MRRVRITGISVLSILLAFVIITVLFFSKPSQVPDFVGLNDDNTPLTSSPESSQEPLREKRESAAFSVVRDMKAGWNLGNSLESLDHQKRGINSELTTITAEEYYETLWGNPVTTAKTIAGIAEMGFGAVRLPVTWQDHMDDEYHISLTWLKRVKDVVDYVLANDMYCIINLHHDTGEGTWPWLKADPDNLAESERILRFVWKQIAEYFHDYGDKLVFESFNELLDNNGRWSDSAPECYEAVNRLNQVFVDAIRATGGLNSQRFLIVTPYAASPYGVDLKHYRLPTDTVEDRLIASVHTYVPLGFTWQESALSWAETYSEWDWNNSAGERELAAILRSIGSHLVNKGIPVIISECGAWNKNNSDERIAYVEFLIREASEYQIACFWWDEGGTSAAPERTTSSALYDRYNDRWIFPDVAKAFVKAAEEAWIEE